MLENKPAETLPTPSKYTSLTIRIGVVLREEREHLRISREELAAKAGISVATLCRIETGKCGDVGIETVNNIAASLAILGGRRLGLAEMVLRAEILLVSTLTMQEEPKPNYGLELSFYE